MKVNIVKIVVVFLLTMVFSGCSKFYATAPEKDMTLSVKNKIPVKVKLKQTGSSIVVHSPQSDIKKNVDDIIFDSPIFVEDSASTNVLNIDIVHSNEHGGAEMGNAVLTGASLYLIPGVADSNVDINISMNGVKNSYRGELVIAQGLGASSMIDKDKYIEDHPLNLMKNLLKNAIDEFTLVYLKEEKN